MPQLEDVTTEAMEAFFLLPARHVYAYYFLLPRNDEWNCPASYLDVLDITYYYTVEHLENHL